MKYVKNAINTQKAIFSKSSIPHRQVTFADEDKSDIPIRAVSQPDTTQTPQYQKKSLDTIMMEQELAQL